MSEQSSTAKRARHGIKRRRRHLPFNPPEPPIVAGGFTGKRLSDLSNAELEQFMQMDARLQTREVAVPSPTVTPATAIIPSAVTRLRFPDYSQYWFAKFQLESRKPKWRREEITLDIAPDDSQEAIALKLVNYAYKAGARKYHPDLGGDHTAMQRLNQACEFARERLKKSG